MCERPALARRGEPIGFVGPPRRDEKDDRPRRRTKEAHVHYLEAELIIPVEEPGAGVASIL